VPTHINTKFPSTIAGIALLKGSICYTCNKWDKTQRFYSYFLYVNAISLSKCN